MSCARETRRQRRCYTATGKAVALLKRFIQKVRSAINRAILPWRFRDRIHSMPVDELPDSLVPHRLYLIGSGIPWSAALLCPCGCGEVIQISLLPDDSPSWTFKSDRDGLPVLSPSIWRTKGCRSHFFLRHGSVEWCKGLEYTQWDID